MKDRIKNLIKKIPIPLTKNHRYDLQTKRIIKTYLKSDSNCIDVGCHKGEILDLILSAAPHGSHFGFEPIPVLYQQLKKHFQSHPNCQIMDFALSNEAGTDSFNYVKSNPSYSGLIKRKYDRPNEQDEQIQVKKERLDCLIPDDIKIDFIKIDVEGGEMGVLQGASKILANQSPIILFEHGKGASEFYGTSPEMVFEYLAQYNMKIYSLGNFLKSKSPFNLIQFQDQYTSGENYYFVATK